MEVDMTVEVEVEAEGMAIWWQWVQPTSHIDREPICRVDFATAPGHSASFEISHGRLQKLTLLLLLLHGEKILNRFILLFTDSEEKKIIRYLVEILIKWIEISFPVTLLDKTVSIILPKYSQMKNIKKKNKNLFFQWFLLLLLVWLYSCPVTWSGRSVLTFD